MQLAAGHNTAGRDPLPRVKADNKNDKQPAFTLRRPAPGPPGTATPPFWLAILRMEEDHKGIWPMVTASDLRALIKTEASPAISIFMPTHIIGREVRQDAIRLRNLLDDASRRLGVIGCRRPAAEALLAPAMQLTRDGNFWRHQDRGLAIFVTPEIFRHFRVPVELDEHITVGRHFCIRPLLPLVATEERFLVLAVSAVRARVFDATPAGMAEMNELDLPIGVAEVAAETVYQNSRRTNPGSRIVKTQNLGESPEEQRKAQLIEYLQRVASAAQKHLAGNHRPVVLAAQPEVRGNFQAISRLTPLLSLDVNPDALDRRELHRRAFNIVKPVLEAARGAALQRIEQLLGESDPRATTDPDKIVTTAREGRIDTLVLTDSADPRDRYEEPANWLIDHQRQEAEDEDLLNYSAAQTLVHKGHVMVMPKRALAGIGIAAALLRY